MGSENSESLLLEKIKGGDEYAFEIAFLKYYTPMCKYIWKFVRSEALAEEIVQDVFGRIWERRKKLDPNGHLRGLLYEAARNKALDNIKHQKIIDTYIAETKKTKREYATIKGNDKPSRELVRDIEEAIEGLPPKARQVYILNREEGLTYKEIAGYLEISIKTVESRMRRVLQILRAHLSKYLSLFIPIFWGLGLFR